MAEKDVQSESSSLVGDTKEFFQGSLAELKKISTPTRQETMQATLVTLFIIGLLSISLFLLDLFFHTLLQALV